MPAPDRLLPPFNPTARCPKCGCGFLRTHYCMDAHYPHDARLKMLDKTLGEHLDRVCDDCGYTWLEQTIDTPMTPPTRPVTPGTRSSRLESGS
jgi:hypothetical protein